MTIIQPNKNRQAFHPFILVLTAVLAFSAFSGIYFYNANVKLRHAIGDSAKNLQELEASNANYKNNLYKILDANNVEAVAAQKQLIQEKNPKYMESKSEILASN